MKRKVLVNSNSYHGYSIDDAIEGISAAGFKYIELTATKGWTEHVFVDQSFKELQRIKDKLKEYDLTALAMSGHTSLMDKNRREDFVNNIHLANFYGCKYIVTSVGEAHLETKELSSDEMIVENLKSFVKYLKDYDMHLVVEVHGADHGTGVILKKIVNKVDSKRVSVAYDTANAVFYGDVDVVKDLEASIGVVDYIHMKDKAGKENEWNFPALGEGYLDFESILSVLDKNKNPAPLSIEIEFTEEGPASLEEVNKAVLDSKKHLEKLSVDIG